MRHIKRDAANLRQTEEAKALPRSVPVPQNVVEALAANGPEEVFVVEEPETMVPEVPEAPKFNAQMKKSELIQLALSMGVSITEEMTKAQILDALKAAS
jgi:hypothetical protein